MTTKLLEDLPGVGPATAEKLREAGFNSIEAIAVASPGEQVAVAEVGEATIAKIIAGARKAADVGGFESDDRILERRKLVGKINYRLQEFQRPFRRQHGDTGNPLNSKASLAPARPRLPTKWP